LPARAALILEGLSSGDLESTPELVEEKAASTILRLEAAWDRTAQWVCRGSPD
jgi:hypothetical protein